MREEIKIRSNSTKLILNTALKKGLKVKIISKRFHLLRISSKDKSIFVKSTGFPVNPQSGCIISNNKFLTKKVLRLCKIPVPKSWLVQTSLKARKIVLKNKPFPCVVKPTRGAHGRKVFANIESIEEFNEILPLVFDQPEEKDVLIEQFIKGRDYRVMVVGNKVSAIMERIPAHVVGNGKSNIRQLVKKFNQNPLVGEKYEKPMCKIRFNGEVKRILKKQNKKLTYVPQKGEKVFLRQNANISTGGIGKDVTDNIDQGIKNIALQATKAVHMRIAGVDIIQDELTRKSYVLELNDCPGIDIHHFPVIGKSRNVAGDIVNFLFNNND